jgi:glutathione S-transferase
MLTVHHLNNSRSHRIAWLLEELGVPYSIQHYERDTKSGMAPESLKAIHPLGKSPILTDDGRPIAESGAIIDYIIRRHGEGRLTPEGNSEEYDQYVHWLHYAEGSASLPLIMKGTVNRLDNKWRPLKNFVASELHLHLSYIDASLQRGPFLLGELFTAADVQMSFVAEVAALLVDRNDYPAMDAWIRRLQARPAYRRAVDTGGDYALARAGAHT